MRPLFLTVSQRFHKRIKGSLRLLLCSFVFARFLFRECMEPKPGSTFPSSERGARHCIARKSISREKYFRALLRSLGVQVGRVCII